MEATSSSSDVQRIAFNNAAQLEILVDRLKAGLAEHISRQCQGNAAAIRDVEDLLEREYMHGLPDMIHQNITVKGLSWEEYNSKSSQTTQPLDSALNHATIAAQDAAFQMSRLSCAARTTKPIKLASQVDTRIQRVMTSSADKFTLLGEQRQRREARRRLKDMQLPRKEDTIRSLHAADILLERAARAITVQNAEAQRAEDIAAEVGRLRQIRIV